MEHENPGQVEAALKTFANSGEICGVAFGIWFLLGALSMLPLGWNTVLFLSFKDDKGKIDIGSKEAGGKRANEV